MKRCIARITIAALVLGSGPAFADESLCTGKNLIPQIEVQEPAIAAELAREAAATPYGVGPDLETGKRGFEALLSVRDNPSFRPKTADVKTGSCSRVRQQYGSGA